MYLFRNDYSMGAHPQVLSALSQTNLEGNVGYGDDDYCARAAQLIRTQCQAPQAMVEFLIGGTQANFIAIHAFLRPWEGVICPNSGHINGHEAGAVEATGHKLFQVPVGPEGKLVPTDFDSILLEGESLHTIKPRLVYISNATESGTVYTKAELTALSQYCRSHDLLLFVDGARLGVALSSPANDLTLADMAALTDAFYIGGTKNGTLMGEALVITNPALQQDFFRIKKQQGGVLAKGWLLGVQFETLFKDGLYWDLARHANQMAQQLQDGLVKLGYPLMTHSPTNQIFIVVPNSLMPILDTYCAYEVWNLPGTTHTTIRFVTSFATTQEDVTGLLTRLAEQAR